MPTARAPDPILQVASRSKLGAPRGSGYVLSSRAGVYQPHLGGNSPMFPHRIRMQFTEVS